MKLRTVIIDDEPLALDKLRSYAMRVPFLEVCARFQSAFEALEYLATTQIDLIFTDINMPDLNGVEFAESLTSGPMIIFTTAYSEYAIDSYRLGGVDYLLKPYRFIDFQRAANRALISWRVRHPESERVKLDSIFVKVDSRLVRVDLDDIIYIKGYGEYLQIYTTTARQPLMTLSSFASIMTKLSDNFMQVHRSYVVNMERVQHVERSRIIIDQDTYIPVSDGYKEKFTSWLDGHTVRKSLK